MFDAWTDAEQFKAWMCPPGSGLDRCEIDARVGGSWLAHGFRSDGSRFAKAGVYREVKRPERLVFTWPHQPHGGCTDGDSQDTYVEVTLRAVDEGKTEITLVHGPFFDLPGFTGHGEGWQGCFEKLAAFLAK
ncbi:MAG: SRPBCC domain-containing protein [Alphaproteobacteria bacterium]|nr:SRPBCC domain-containing protein [Alphaproteobacteria bacterium]